jgi:hypothetical protein
VCRLALAYDQLVDTLRSGPIRATSKPGEVVDRLKLLPDEKALLRTLYDTSGRALEVSDFVLAGDRHVLVYEVSAG